MQAFFAQHSQNNKKFLPLTQDVKGEVATFILTILILFALQPIYARPFVIRHLNEFFNPQDMLSYAHFTDEINQDPEYWEHYFSSLNLLSLCIYIYPYIYTHKEIYMCVHVC